MTGLGYCSEHYLAVMSTRPTIGVSRRKGDFSCHVCPNQRGRASHFSSITRTPLDASMRGRKKRKQGEDNALVGSERSSMGSMLCTLVNDTSIGGLMIRRGRASNQWWHHHLSPHLLAYFNWRGLLCLSDFIHSWKRECLDRFCSSTSALSGWCICGLTRLARKAFQSPLILAVVSRYLTIAWMTSFMHFLATVGHKVSNYWKYGILLAAEEVVRAGVLSYAPGSESVHTFHLSHFHRLSVCVWLLGRFVCFGVVSFCSLTNLCDRVINRWPV